MADAAVQTGTIRTRVPARLDRLPWSRFHWRILVGLGTVWILDGLEVTMVGNVASRITQKGSGLHLTAGDIGIAGAIYIIGACIGALYFGHLTDRFGRKKLFMLTLGIYILATFATAFSFAPWWFFLARFFTGSGIGGEYAAINSAIDELIPARVRGRVDLVINGTYWAGSAGGAALALVFLNEAWIPGWLGWRLAFGVGVVLGLGILLVRRHVPESPRWLFIHGNEEEAERIVDEIESDVREQTGQELDKVDEELTVRQRTTIPFRTIAHTAFKLYPKRAILGIALFVGQAFIYNGITFNLGTLFTNFYQVAAGFVPVFFIIYAIGNLLGPLTLGRLFDTVGRKPMISGTYIGSALVTIPLGLIFLKAVGGEWLLIILIVITFFLASAGASAAYLTVSEIFPMETRALAIAFFYAIGTAVGGIAGPLLFGQLIGSGDRTLVMVAFFIGAAVMAVGGVVELFFGVKAERASLESIAQPLTAAEAESGGQLPGASGDTGDTDQGAVPGTDGTGHGPPAGPDRSESVAQQARTRALQCREEAERALARAAAHRADAREATDPDTEPVHAGGTDSAEIAMMLAQIEQLRAQAGEQQAIAYDELAEPEQPGAPWRAEAAEQRARSLYEQAAELECGGGDGRDGDIPDEARLHQLRAAAADARARSREQLALAAQEEAPTERAPNEAAEGAQDSGAPDADAPHGGADGDRPDADSGATTAMESPVAPPPVSLARAQAHRAWSDYEEECASALDAQASGDLEAARRHEEQSTVLQRHALAMDERVQQAEHHAEADRIRGERAYGEQQTQADRQAMQRREQEARDRAQRIRERMLRREQAYHGLRRWVPGPTTSMPPPFGGGQASQVAVEQALDREIDVIARALQEHGTIRRAELAALVGARYWGPGRFGAALDAAVTEGRARRLARATYGPPAEQRPRKPGDADGGHAEPAGGQHHDALETH